MAFAGAPAAIAIHNARVIPVSGPAIPRGSVIVRNGLIEAVGADLAVPSDAWVIEVEDRAGRHFLDRLVE